MKRIMKVLLVMVCMMCCLIGCGQSEPNTELLGSLVGTWQEKKSDETKTMVFNADMTFVEKISVTGEVPISVTSNGTFSLDGDKISLNYEEYGVVSDYTITINGNSFVLDNGDAQIELVKK